MSPPIRILENQNSSKMEVEEGNILWTPSKTSIIDSKMSHFLKRIEESRNISLSTYQNLHTWSIENISNFWEEIWQYCGIISSCNYDNVVDETLLMAKIPKWFQGSRLNFAENLLKYRDDKIAIIYESEFGEDRRTLSYKDLYHQTAQLATALCQMGIKVNDVVAAYSANVPEVVILMLAAASIGAQFTTIAPEFGVIAAADRLEQTKPKILLVSEAVFYNGKIHSQVSKVQEIAKQCTSLEKIITLPSPSNDSVEGLHCDKIVRWADFVKVNREELKFEQLPFNHPLYILYSSGTTGKPKCLVHSSGGTLIQHLKEHILHGDLSRNDIFMQYTTIGWMMWHWLISSLAIGCTIVLYEGSPFKPHLETMLKIVEKYNITRFGTSAKYIQHLQENKYVSKLDLSSLKTIYSTGSPLCSSNYFYIHENLGSHIQIASITGGTDIISLFGAPNPMVPVYAGQIQCIGLGMALDVRDSNGSHIKAGETGDLVCFKAFPSMPVYFINDIDGSKYRSSYFYQSEEYWSHGDFVKFIPQTGGLVMLGRSDGTLNPSGVRFGSADLYNIINKFTEVEDSIVVGVRRPNETDERVIVFLKTIENPGMTLNSDLIDRLKVCIRNQLSPRHVPALILATPEIPYTINGKKMEIAVKRILSCQGEICLSSIANPESLQFYRNLTSNL